MNIEAKFVNHKVLATLIVALFLSLIPMSVMSQENQGMKDGRFVACPSSPNCVSSMAVKKSKHISAISYSTMDKGEAKALLMKVCTDWETEVVKEDGNYIHMAFKTSTGKFIDDVEFYFPTDDTIIHLKSCSRLGWWDFGANRRRLKKISKGFEKGAL